MNTDARMDFIELATNCFSHATNPTEETNRNLETIEMRNAMG